MRNHRLAFIASVSLFMVTLWGCKTSSVTSSSEDLYQEDLSGLRPELAPAVTVIPEDSSTTDIEPENSMIAGIKSELDSVNQIITERNKSVRYVDGYTIQVYIGNNREMASEARDLVISLDESLSPDISYYQPTYKVKVGQYTNRLEAHKIYESLKPHFRRAVVVPERIRVNYE
ncbi:MAG: SPOR domain-containing protein [Cyclobacteriaceae bacterium]